MTKSPELIEKIYALALDQDELDRFMAQWCAFVEREDAADGEAASLETHFAQALRVLENVRNGARAPGSPAALVGAADNACCVVDPAGVVIAASPMWQQSRLAAATGAAPPWLRDSRVAAAIRRACGAIYSGMDFVRLSTTDGDAPTLAISQAHFAERDGPRAVVRLLGPVWSDALQDVLAAQYGLTPAELAVAQALLSPLDLVAIAAERSRAPDTVKAQAKAVYRKLEVAGRAEFTLHCMQLQYLLLSSGSSVRREAQDPPPLTQRQIAIVHGRTLAYRDLGDPHGAPVLFLHGMLLGHGLRAEVVERLERSGLRLICPDRPGYGESDLLPEQSAVTDGVTHQLLGLLDHLAIEQVTVVSHTSGILFACGLAGAAPQRVNAIVGAAAGVPIADAAALRVYPTRVRAIAYMARRFPNALRFAISAASETLLQLGADDTIRGTYRHVDSDRRILEDPEVFELVKQGHQLAVDGGLDGFCNDARLIWSDWTSTIAAVQCPILYLNGDQDSICPPQWAAALANRFVNVELQSVPGAGQLLQHSHPELFVSAVVRGVNELARSQA